MSRQEEDTKAEISPMMTEQGREELYLYSLRKMAEERADSDRAALTGLYGPKSFFFKANECMQQHEKLQYALIRMDIYRFKTVNEFCGRQQGDKLLQYIADCIREYESDMSVVGHLRADILQSVFHLRIKSSYRILQLHSMKKSVRIRCFVRHCLHLASAFQRITWTSA